MRRAGTRAFGPVASVILAVCVLTLTFAAVTPAGAQDEVRIVGMVVSSGTDEERADRVVRSLDALNAEILRATAPSNAELRAMMRRFSQEAAQADAAFVFLDMPAVKFEERHFVLPNRTRINRPTDIFTEAVPLRAFARMTVLSERGGAVILAAETPEPDLPDGITRPETAPAPLIGSSEILFVPAQDAGGVLDVLDDKTDRTTSVDLREVLEAMALAPQASLSGLPAAPIVLKAPPIVESPPTEPIAVPVPDIIEETDTNTPATEAELAILEQSLSPPVKRDLQRTLRSLGHYSGLIDGIIGVQTRQAIKDFQVARSESETGLLTPAQLVELLTPE